MDKSFFVRTIIAVLLLLPGIGAAQDNEDKPIPAGVYCIRGTREDYKELPAGICLNPSIQINHWMN